MRGCSEAEEGGTLEQRSEPCLHIWVGAGWGEGAEPEGGGGAGGPEALPSSLVVAINKTNSKREKERGGVLERERRGERVISGERDREMEEESGEEEVLGSSLTMEKVAAAKQFIENHYRTQMKTIQERKER